MRGEVFYYDGSQGVGFITADHGDRYAFDRSDLRQTAVIAKGLKVDFRVIAGRAREIFPVPANSYAKKRDNSMRTRFSQFMTALGFSG